ncbi:MAG: MoaD/ThiS family protein [Chloroflexi bacterium]|nr:MoaD/ThiS family protein [Chloroflexota bacterium]
MLIHVRLAEPFWRAAGSRTLALELPAPATIADLLARLEADYPALKTEIELSPPLIFIGEMEAERTSSLAAGALVHLVWPLAGG